jgi:hypothetical protein
MANFAARQRHLGSLVEDRPLNGWRWHQQRARFPIVAEIVGGVGGNHAGPLPDPQQIDRAQHRMGVRAAQEGDAQHSRPLDIVHELRPAGEQTGVLVARDRSAEITGGHRIPAIRPAEDCW